MSADTENRLDRLFAAARAGNPDTSAQETNFETRVLARIRERRAAGGTPWYALAWRMIPAFAALAAIIAVCTISFNPSRSHDLFTAITYGQDEYMANSFLSGD